MNSPIGNGRAVILAASLTGVALITSGTPGSAQSGTNEQKLTIYAVAKTVQFMNHADDRVRGMSVNPFNIKSGGRVVITKTKEKGNGPFPGDDLLYSFKLYESQSLVKTAGSAIFTCYYDLVKHAVCDSYFELKDGLILASGAVVFNSTRFTLSVTGGTRKYIGVGGAVNAVPAGKNTQRLDLVLTR